METNHTEQDPLTQKRAPTEQALDSEAKRMAMDGMKVREIFAELKRKYGGSRPEYDDDFLMDVARMGINIAQFGKSAESEADAAIDMCQSCGKKTDPSELRVRSYGNGEKGKICIDCADKHGVRKTAESEHEEHPWLTHEQAERVQADHDRAEKSCPFCKSDDIRPINAEGEGRQKSYQCMKCSQRFSKGTKEPGAYECPECGELVAAYSSNESCTHCGQNKKKLKPAGDFS